MLDGVVPYQLSVNAIPNHTGPHVSITLILIIAALLDYPRLIFCFIGAIRIDVYAHVSPVCSRTFGANAGNDRILASNW